MLPSFSNWFSAFFPSYALGSVSKTTTSILSMALLLFILSSRRSRGTSSSMQCKRQSLNPSKRTDLCVPRSKSLREFAKFAKVGVEWEGGYGLARSALDCGSSSYRFTPSVYVARVHGTEEKER